MTKKEYDEQRKQILDNTDQCLRVLDKTYASQLETKNAKIGDIVSDNSSTIKVVDKWLTRYQELRYPFQVIYPKFVYEGKLYTKKGVARKDGAEGRINFIKNVRSKL